MPVDDNHLGRIFSVPDKWWGFEAVGREDHPGACVLEHSATREWVLLKGTGAENRPQFGATEISVLPSEQNRLQKETVFSLRPRLFRNQKLRNLTKDEGRIFGKLSDEDLELLRSGMLRQFGTGR